VNPNMDGEGVTDGDRVGETVGDGVDATGDGVETGVNSVNISSALIR